MTSLWRRPARLLSRERWGSHDRTFLSRLLKVAAVAGLSLLVLRSIPDVRRYLRLRGM